VRLLDNEADILAIVLPMVPEFLAAMGYENMLPEVVGLLRDIDNIHTFVLLSNDEPAGFATFMASFMPRNPTLHLWHIFVRPQYRNHSYLLYDLTKFLMDELSLDNLSFTSVNHKIAEHMARQYQQRGIQVKLTGYFYRSFHNTEKRYYQSLLKELSRLSTEMKKMAQK